MYKIYNVSKSILCCLNMADQSIILIFANPPYPPFHSSKLNNNFIKVGVTQHVSPINVLNSCCEN